METHSSVLAWRIPWMEGPGGLQSVGLQSRTLLSKTHTHTHTHTHTLGLPCYMQAFSSCCEQELLFINVAWASHCGGFSCYGAQALGAQAL